MACYYLDTDSFFISENLILSKVEIGQMIDELNGRTINKAKFLVLNNFV